MELAGGFEVSGSGLKACMCVHMHVCLYVHVLYVHTRDLAVPFPRFTKMTRDLHDVAGGMRQLTQLGLEHLETVDAQVVDVLRDYSGIIHTLPVLVKLHEEAMEIFNSSKEKDSVSQLVPFSSSPPSPLPPPLPPPSPPFPPLHKSLFHV